ncbi:TM2 domain-containing protein [Mucilaginibacter sp. UR6-11]|uniref:TM2 domain-containing protein n=1 Tax=Mucilaginibacter sp. UR6-11 TaxID=1435644 RepID=UPI001E5D2E37|nr:TM2 domain-containing protein [Mucilaginibacter sp. UR6-11]MCC8424434.1 TM2 domain-containing protein [Mucilaginibacter sp. UR6-11]
MNMQQNPYMNLSGITTEELAVLQQATAGLNDDQKKYFFMIYSGKRKSPQDMLIFSLIGLFLLPGLQRFITGQIGMGILYLFTVGLCFIGSIMDLVNHKTLAYEYNQKMAFESFNLAKMGN